MIDKVIKLKKILFGLFLAIAGTAMAGYIGGNYYFSHHYFPGTMICGVNAGLQTPEDIRDLLKEDTDNYVIKVTSGAIKDKLKGPDAGLTYTCVKDETILPGLLDAQDTRLWFNHLQETFENDYDVVLDEDTLRKSIESLDCIASDQVQPSTDAYIDKQDGKYVIIPEVQGNELNKDVFFEELKGHILSRDSAYAPDCYIPPVVTSKSKELTKQIEAYEQVANNVITISSPYEEITLEGEELAKLITLKNGKVKVRTSKLEAYVEDKIRWQFNTIGDTKWVSTPGSGSFSVSGGTYGNVVDCEGTVEKLKEAILDAQEITISPAYSKAETYLSNGGLGSTYIDVNIAKQKVWVVYNGEVVLTSKCVTGNVSENNGTPTGIYWIEYKRENYQMNEYGNGVIVKRWMCISNETGVGLHDAKWRSSFGGNIYKTNGSHGCVNLPTKAAKQIYEYAFGTMPVVVH